ncbi:response regulator transcription factor [Microlunatus ginsengisoli]|uniref:Response regulator transcription factor n=1 Tax=Microlunatus ginsengisoli TaxID=363863 RepID=A0ABP6ZQD7_9ACTN
MSGQPERVAVVIEDDADIRNLLEAILAQAGFSCYTAADGVEGIAAVREYKPILTTLDISLPGIDGFEVARRIRAFSMSYIIMLSARDEEIDTLMGLDAGADDYLTKPFRPRELRARIEAMLRRYHQSPPTIEVSAARPAGGTAQASAPAPVVTEVEPEDDDSGWLTHNGLRINADMWLCDLDGAPLELTRSEFDLLLAIMQGQRRVISKDSLALELRGEYGSSGYVSDSDRRAVEVHMANLRRKLNDPVSKPRYIETVRGVGYRLAEPD